MMKRVLLSLAMLLLASVSAMAGTCTTAVTWLNNSPTTSVYFADTISASNLISCMTLTGPAGAALLPDAAALADATANPTTTGISAYLFSFNGTTWDRAHTVASTQGATTSGQYGIPAMAATASASPSLTTAQTNMLSQDLNGRLRVDTLGGCSGVINIAQTATTDVHTFTGFGYICSIMLVSATAQSIGVDEGTGTTCETGGTALIGVSSTSSATPQVAVAQNGGFSMSFGIKTQASADHLCVLQSGAGEVAGVITYKDLTN